MMVKLYKNVFLFGVVQNQVFWEKKCLFKDGFLKLININNTFDQDVSQCFEI